jgi:1-aminocyclopropane-1-carboxylate deaminase/D-cysteine desulfhydrase-like pyridoxal-dependent ACC family enzyme
MLTSLTPIEKHGGFLVKRDDLFEVAGVCGGKARTCWYLAQGAEGLVTAGSRQSPQVNIVAHIAKELGIPCRVHTPTGALSPELESAVGAGAELVQHRPGYNSVIIKRARDDAAIRGWAEIPFGMQCWEAVYQTARQYRNIPADIKRIVITVGSGMSLAGILNGMLEFGDRVPVLGIQVGADPTKRLRTFGPVPRMVQLKKPDIDYHVAADKTKLGGLQLDPIYEAKCLPYLEPGDLFWVVGIRKTAVD